MRIPLLIYSCASSSNSCPGSCSCCCPGQEAQEQDLGYRFTLRAGWCLRYVVVRPYPSHPRCSLPVMTCSLIHLPRIIQSGMIATSIIQPMDMIKVRIQLAGEGAKGKAASPFAVAGQLIKNEGFFALYKGLSAGLLRQVRALSCT